MSAFFLWSRSVRTDFVDYATLILYDGSTSYLNWYGSCWLPHGVACDHFQWSRSNGQVDTHCPYIILDDGLGLYGKGYGYSWLVYGVARYVYSGRGVCI